jgi:hypothetical protein
VAVRTLSGLVEVLLDGAVSVARAWRDHADGRSDLVEIIRANVRPIPGVAIVVPDGQLMTGLIIVADNRPVMMLVARRAPPPGQWSRAEPWHPAGPSGLTLFEDEYHQQ